MSRTKDPNSKRGPSRDIEASGGENTVLQEGVDYYVENGLMVFTSAFLGRRGYCCERGCRHCPYGYSDHQNLEG